MSRHVQFALVCFMAAPSAYGKGPLPNKEASDRYAMTLPQVFVINRDDPSVFAQPNGGSPKSVAVKMGEMYFAKDRRSNYYLLAKYDNLQGKWGKELGWVSADDVLLNGTPKTVAEAVKDGVIPDESRLRDSSAMTRTNALHLRVVSKPERQIDVSRKPGDSNVGGSNWKFTWYYVFDLKKVAGKWYYLIGTSPTLYPVLDPDTSSKNADVSLLGWIDATSVKEWCSNVVLEYNCDELAVRERLGAGRGTTTKARGSKPARIMQGPDWSSKPVATEQVIEYWGHLDGKTSDASGNTPLAQVDPIGLVPSVPRFHVVSKKDDWYKVATLGSVDGQVSQSEIARTMMKLEDACNKIRQVDLVFVVDATGSMNNEIAAVLKWLQGLSDSVAKRSQTGRMTPIIIGGERKEFPTDMEIFASLISYQDVEPSP